MWSPLMDVLVLGILLVLVPIDRIIEDITGDAFGFGLVTQNVFVIISLPDVTRIQFATGTTGDGNDTIQEVSPKFFSSWK